MTTKQETARNEARAKLLQWIKPGQTIYTILRQWNSASGYGWFDLYVILDNEPLRITYTVADATGAKYNIKHEAIASNDGFTLVYNLSMALFCPDKYDHEAAYSLKERRI